MGTLWQDIRRVAEQTRAGAPAATHFLGAIVTQAAPTALGSRTEFHLIDGQQRLTTSQLLFDAAGAHFEAAGLATRVQQLAFLTHNPAFGTHDGDLLKLHQLNDNKAPFSAVMEAPAPVEYADLPAGRTVDTLYHRNDDGSRLVATVSDAGSLRHAGREYDSPSGTAKAAHGAPRNGWTFWRLAEGLPLQSVRDAVLRGHRAAGPDPTLQNPEPRTRVRRRPE